MMHRSIQRTAQVLGVASIATILIATSSAQGVSAGTRSPTGSGAASFQVLKSGPLHESFARPVVFGGFGASYVASIGLAGVRAETPLGGSRS